MASRKRETYQIEPRTYVLFVFELDDGCQFRHKQYTSSWLYLIRFSSTTSYLCMYALCNKIYYFPLYILLTLHGIFIS